MASLTQLIQIYYRNAAIDPPDQKTKADLKPRFLTGEIPEENDFMGLIYNGMSFKEDGIFKNAENPLCIQAGTADPEKLVLLFYDDPSDEPNWQITINQGFNIRGGDMNRFRISESGNIGIGVEGEIRSNLQIGEKMTFNVGEENFVGYNLYKKGENLRRVTEGPASELEFDIDGTIKIRTIEQGAANSIIQFQPDNGVFFQNDGSLRINRSLFENEFNSSILLDVSQFYFNFFQGIGGTFARALTPQASAAANSGISNILAFDNQDTEQENNKLLFGVGSTVYGIGEALNTAHGIYSAAVSNDRAYGLVSFASGANTAYGAKITARAGRNGVQYGIHVDGLGEDNDFAGYFIGNVVVTSKPVEEFETTSGYKLYVDGAAFSARGWDMEGGDYSELFESKDGLAISQGISVVFGPDGKIRPAEQDEVPIGVVTQSSGVTGNNYNEWPKKYLKDEFGNILYEEVEKLLEPGPIISKLHPETEREVELIQVPKLNPEYDKSLTYIRREKRPEWNKVGLLGQLHLRKGQPVAPYWSKIKDISADIELWLVK